MYYMGNVRAKGDPCAWIGLKLKQAVSVCFICVLTDFLLY